MRNILVFTTILMAGLFFLAAYPTPPTEAKKQFNSFDMQGTGVYNIGKCTLAGNVAIADDTLLQGTATGDLAAAKLVDANVDAAAAITRSKLANTETNDITHNAQSDVRLADADSSNWIARQAAAVIGSNFTLTEPSSAPSADGQAYVCTMAGVCSFATVLTDPVANLTVTNTLVVDTNSLVVDPLNNAVGIGTASPATGAMLSVEAVAGDQAARFKYSSNSQLHTVDVITTVLANTNTQTGNSVSIWGANSADGVTAGMQFYALTHAAGTGSRGEIGFNVADTTATPPELMRVTSQTGTFTNTGNRLVVSPAETKIYGVVNGSSAAAGVVGEYTETSTSNRTFSAIDVTGETIVSITLTTGDWDVAGGCNVIGGASGGSTVISHDIFIVGTSTNTTEIGGYNQSFSDILLAQNLSFPHTVTAVRANITAASEVYSLKGTIDATVSAARCYGSIRARRVR